MEKEGLLKQQILENTPERYRELVKKAIEFAVIFHKDKYRLNGESEVTHALATALMAAQNQMDADSIIASILHHGFYSDRSSTQISEDIQKEFGHDVVQLIAQLNTINEITKTTNIRSAKTQIKFLLTGLPDLRVTLIKLWDVMDNSHSINFIPIEKRKHFINKTLNIYGPLAEYFNLGPLKKAIEENAFKAQKPDLFEFISESFRIRNITEESFNRYLDFIKTLLEVKSIEGQIKGRIKSKYSLYRKFQKYFDEGINPSFNRIFDLFAFTVILPTVDKCYELKESLAAFTNVDMTYSEDYIVNPKKNGFSTLQIITQIPEITDRYIEIQIQTPEMSYTNTYGSASHIAYKASLQRFVNASGDYLWVENLHKSIQNHKLNRNLQRSCPIPTARMSNEIYAMTPKGTLIELQEGDTVMHFAKSVHSLFPAVATMAKVNGVMQKLDYTVKSGDIIEVIVDRSRIHKLSNSDARRIVKSLKIK